MVGNKKGLLTRSRQPKMAAYELRRRYLGMINATLPSLRHSLKINPYQQQMNGMPWYFQAAPTPKELHYN